MNPNDPSITLSVGWILGVFGILGGVISTLASLLWAVMRGRLEKQDSIIASQGATIEGLQKDVERMAKGCGAVGCHWRERMLPPI